MRRSTLVTLVLAAACSACVPPVPDNDEFVRFDEETVMGVLQDAGVLVVGLPKDVGEPWGVVTATGADGFAADVAAEVAESLRVDLEFRAAPNDELIEMVDSGTVDIAFPVVTMTEELVRKHAFSDPIYVAHQRLLVPEDSAIEDVADVSGPVCSPIDEPIGVELQGLNPDAATLPLRARNAGGCTDLLEQDLVEVATAPDVLLATIVAELGDGYEVTGDQLTTEPLSISLESGASGWVDYVNKVITEFDQEGRWAASYERHFAPLLGGEAPEPPNMTLEEAAALFPADLED